MTHAPDTFGVRLMKAQNMKEMMSNRLAQEIECATATIAQMRMDRHMPSAAVLRRMCKALGVSADYLLGLSDEPDLRRA